MLQTEVGPVGKERLRALYQQQLNQEYCDIVVKVGKQKFHAHSCILAAASPKLHNLIQKGSKQTRAKSTNPAKEICLKMFTPTSFLHLIPYFYLGAIEYSGLSMDDLQSIMKSAKWCNFDEIVSECNNLIEKETNTESIKDTPKQSSASEITEILLKCEFCERKFKMSDLSLFTDHVASHNNKTTASPQKEIQLPDKETSKTQSTESNSKTSPQNKSKGIIHSILENASSDLQTVVLQYSPTPSDHGSEYSNEDEMSPDDSCSVSGISIVCEFDDDSVDADKISRRKPRKSKPQKLPRKKTKKITNMQGKTWSCLLCPDELFYRKRDQVLHVRQNHGVIKRFSCDHCGKDFTAASLLKAHLRTHSQERTDVCVECGKCFADKKNLKDHLRKHTGEKPYLCTECGKSFTFRQSLYRHMKFHEGEKPHTCEICGKAFVLKHNLKEHLDRHEKHNTITCKQCQVTLPTKEDAVAHLKTCRMYMP
uniref:ZF(C2H2)-53 zinc finger protein n=1 Tax=Phallusia mammillata TaxID=59560 RepID=A0A6F9DL33_9ASCI|nr:ZF(C2H2)-53 zinc finger protein [Phallusia mammillata]